MQHHRDACPRCGLIPQKWDGRPGGVTAAPELEATWQNALKNWENPASHALFVERCLSAAAADYAAKKYRDRGDDPIACDQLERLTTRLLQDMSHTAAESRPSRRGLRALFAFFLAAAIVAAILWLVIS